ncbi:MAG: alpha/beta fold hydrolase [Firmicutes bacterium]|nr:alpha/beta fold hydrolase [Bacillota bacterium]
MVVLVILIILLLLAAAALFFFAQMILNKVFGNRCEGNPNVKYFQGADFPGLLQTPISFPSNRGQKLRGFLYYTQQPDYKGLVIFVHGMGAGHTAYTTEINTLAQDGYIVLGYDNTGTMLSDGASLGGFPQAFWDLQGAVTFVKNSSQLHHHPLFLVGHSWGAYTVANFTHLKEKINGVVAMSPFDSIPDIMTNLVSSQIGKNMSILKPFFLLATLIEFKEMAFYRPSYSLQKAQCPVLLLHGDQDPMAPLSVSPVAFREALTDNPNVRIQICPGKAHNVYNTVEAEKYMAEVFAGYTQLEKNYNQQVPPEIRREYFEKADFRRMTEEDPAVMTQILDFLNQCPVEEK